MPKVKSGRDVEAVKADIVTAQATLTALHNSIPRSTYYSPGTAIPPPSAAALAHAAQHYVVAGLQDELNGTGKWADKPLAPWGGTF